MSPGSSLLDPEAADPSEEQFAASLETSASPPPRYNRIVLPEVAAPEAPEFVPTPRDEFTLAPQEVPGGEGRWRQEVASRVQSYRAKRSGRRIGGAFSMEFDFDEQAEEPPRHYVPAPPAEYCAEAVAPAPPPLTVRWDGVLEDPAPAAPYYIPHEPSGLAFPEVWNVIPFPGSSDELPRGDELAGPVLETLRILDAPEFVQQAIPTPMAEISLDDDEDEALADPCDVEIPLQVVPLPQRAVGGVADLLIVLTAAAVFAAIVWKLAGTVAMSKPVLAVALAIPCFFWMAYQYLFLVHAGRTPGMRVAGLALAEFDGAPVGARLRRSRALALALSSVSLGLGFVWALVDEDTLCWHDRITRTYPVAITGDREQEAGR